MRRVDSLEKTLLLGGIGGRRRRGRQRMRWLDGITDSMHVNPLSWWWTGRPGVLQFMGSQRVGHNWATELKWTELNLEIQTFLCRTGIRQHAWKMIRCCCCSVTELCLTPCDPMDCSTSGSPVLHYLPEFARIHVHWVSDAIQPSYPLSPSSLAFNLSQHQGLFQWIGSSHQVAKVLELQFQHQSFQWIFSVDFLWDRLVWSPCSQGALKAVQVMP